MLRRKPHGVRLQHDRRRPVRRLCRRHQLLDHRQRGRLCIVHDVRLWQLHRHRMHNHLQRGVPALPRRQFLPVAVGIHPHSVRGRNELLSCRLDCAHRVRHLHSRHVPCDSLHRHIPSRLPRYVHPPL
jgi:hypothetical protein